MMATESSRAVSLNNNAVRLIQDGECRKATETLLMALGKLKAAKSRQQQISSSSHKLPAESFACNRRRIFTSQAINTTAGRPTTDCQRQEEPFSMYQKVLLLSSRQDPASLDNRDVSAGVILYNLAVANHLRGLEMNHRISLAKAVRTYEWALSALQRGGHKDFRCCLVRVAILHNVAHANFVAGRTTEALHSFKCLRDILPYTKGGLATDDYAFFSGNMIVILSSKNGGGKRTSALAAAA